MPSVILLKVKYQLILIRMFPSKVNIDTRIKPQISLKNQSDNEIIFIDNEEQFCDVMRENLGCGATYFNYHRCIQWCRKT
jgi:hypothetical protein